MGGCVEKGTGDFDLENRLWDVADHLRANSGQKEGWYPFMSTAYHAKYWAHELKKRCASDSEEKLAGALIDAQVDLFAFKSSLSKGAILADEVGLGKTIEAGLVISQRWAEKSKVRFLRVLRVRMKLAAFSKIKSSMGTISPTLQV